MTKLVVGRQTEQNTNGLTLTSTILMGSIFTRDRIDSM